MSDTLTECRNAILEEAALACEEQIEEFLSTNYSAGQPLSSFSERFACMECARAIRAMKTKEAR